MRKLVTIRKIDDILPIPNADAIEVAVVGGWKVVIKKGEFVIGDHALYHEIDSWIPHEIAPFLSKGKEPRVYEGVLGERLKTVKLRGQISQGLLIPLPSNLVLSDCQGFVVDTHTQEKYAVDADFTEYFGVLKWERPVPASLAGMVRGPFPSFIPKTDQERIQNLKAELAEWANAGMEFEVTEKLDGTSCTIYKNSALMEYGKEPLGVCSRNLDLKDTPENTYWSAARAADVHAVILRDGRNLAIQGEIVGNGIQGNQYKLRNQVFYVFDIYDIDRKCYFTPLQRREFCEKHGLNHVPVHSTQYVLGDGDISQLLVMAEGTSQINDSQREGLVFKSNIDPEISFKAISNKWLLKYDD